MDFGIFLSIKVWLHSGGGVFVSRIPGCRDSGVVGAQVARIPGDRDSEVVGAQVARIPGYRVSGVSGVPDVGLSGSPLFRGRQVQI